MISKQECVDLLVKMGFKAFLESGVVMVSCKDKEAFKTAENAIKETVKEVSAKYEN